MKTSIPKLHSIRYKDRENVVNLYEYTNDEVPPNDVLMGVINAQMDVVVVIGYTKEGGEYFASSTGNHETTNWLLDVAKMRLMKTYDAPEEDEG